MDIKQGIATSLGQSDFVVNAYLADITPQEMLSRPCGGANHIAWQIGHLISSERYFVDKVAPGKASPLPAGFDEKHKKDKAANDDPNGFLPLAEYLRLAKSVRADTLKVIESMTPADFDKSAGPGMPPFLKTVGVVFLFLGPHWVMHAGQWAIIRRKLGRPALF
jgi:hypothetical protein